MKLLVFAFAFVFQVIAVAGETIDLIANKAISDEFIQQYIESHPEAMGEQIEHPKLKRFHYLGVFESSVAAERWKLVCWMLKTYPDIDTDNPLGTLNNKTVLGHAIENGGFVAEDILELRPKAAALWSWDFANDYEVIENTYLYSAALYQNWPLFRKWIATYVDSPISPDTYVWGCNQKATSICKKSILGFLVESNQLELFLELLLKHHALIRLVNGIEDVPTTFKVAALNLFT